MNFSDVTFLALEKAWFTTGPPGPPPTIAALQWQGGGNLNQLLATPITEIMFTGYTDPPAPDPSLQFSHTIADGDVSFQFTVTSAQLPTWANGRTLDSNEARNQLVADLQNWFASDQQYFSVTTGGSIGTYVGFSNSHTGPLEYANSTQLENGVPAADVSNPKAILPDKGTFPIYVLPTAAYDTSLYTTMGVTTLYHKTGWWGLRAPSGWSSTPGVKVLEALMSDASTIPIATITFDSLMHFTTIPLETPPPADTILPFIALPWPGDTTTAQVVWDDLNNPLNTPMNLIYNAPGTKVTDPGEPDADGQCSVLAQALPVNWNWTIEPILTTTLTIPPTIKRKRLQASLYYGGPYGKRAAQTLAAIGATPTNDNLLLITCKELVVDRMAGSSSSQVLAVMPFDYAVLALGFYVIEIPVNSLVWRHLADKHIRTLTFELFNGLGDPHPALAGLNFTTTLQLRYL